ncbi:MAG: tetratricopeptide repeat protein [Cytophagales bacterium]|nr:tetratricopeptide repeat protein [Bernardetiaceae bacterium]MDW8204377.1 tetratricopeptide repeat protein [Cytophagales bacterium]
MRQLLIVFLLYYCSGVLLAQHQSGLDFYVKASQAKKAGQYEQAIQHYEMALQREPTNHFYLYEKGLCEFILRRYPNATATLNSVIKLRNDYVPAYVLLAKIAVANNDSKKVIENLNMAVRYEKDNNKKINYRLYAMSRLFREGNIQQAYEQIQQAYQISQEDTAVVYFYAKINNLLGKYAESEMAIQKILPKIAKQPLASREKYYYELGYAQFHLEQYEKANNSWKQIESNSFKSRIEKFSAKNFAAVALTYFRMYEDSLSNYYAEKALAIEKGFPAAHVILVQLAKRKVDHSVTLPQLQNAAQHEPNPIKRREMLMNIGEQQFQLGRFEEANQTFGQILDADPTNQKAILMRLLIPYHRKDYKTTITATENVIRKTADENAQASFLFLQGLAYKKSGQKENAIKNFRRLMSTSLVNAATIEIEQLTQFYPDEDFNLKLIDPPENAK